MELSKRLAAVAAMVTPGNIVADIGCDHGYVSIYLVEAKIAPRAIAMDVNPGPLQKAGENIARHALSAYIDTRLSDGAMALKEGEAGSVLCAGMGGRLMIRILKQGGQKLLSVRELILQPQSEIRQVRCFLREEGYFITAENMILEDGKFYPVIKAVPEKEKAAGQEVRDVWDQYGRLLLESRNRTLHSMLELELGKHTRILEDLREKGRVTQKQKRRCLELETRIAEIREALSYYQPADAGKAE